MVNTGTNSGKAAFAAALAAVVIGGAVLYGWTFDLEYLKRIIPGFIAMNPVTAVAFILAGISLALLLRSPRGEDQTSRALILTARLCALTVTSIGLARLVAILSGWDPGVDQWLFGAKLTNGLKQSNRIAPNAALNFLLLGGALLLLDVKRRSVRRGVECAAVVVGVVSLLAILGYAFGVQPLYHIGPFRAMAMHTAVTFFILSAGVLLALTDRGLLAVFAGDNAGGKMARCLLPAAVFAPALIGWLAWLGEKADIPVAFCDAAETVVNILVFTVLVCWTARRLFSAENRSKKAEEAARESEKRFFVAFEHAPIGVALLSPAGRWLKVNRAFCDMVGYSEADLLARTCHDITHPDDVQTCVWNLHELVTGNIRLYRSEKRYLHAGGRQVTVSFNASLVRDGQGQPNYLIAQIQDITEREHAEVVLLESKRFLQATLDALSSHIAILDEHGVIVEVNAAWNRHGGPNGFKDGPSVVGDNYLQICEAAAARYSGDASAVAGGIRAVMAGQSDEFQLEYPAHGPLERSWFLVRVTRFGGEGPVRVVVAHENITERKQAELARNESQLRYHSLFEHMLEGYARCQLLYEEGLAKDYVYLEVNNTFGPQTGLNNVAGKKVSEVVPGMHESNPEQLEIYSRVAATGIPEKFETYAKSLGIWFSVSVYSHEKDHFVAVFDNITERKRAEAELRWKTAFLEAQVNSSLDGVLVADGQGKKLLQNQRLTDLLKIPQHITDDPDDEMQRLWIMGMTRDPAASIVKVAYLKAHPNETSREEIELADGTALDCYSAPVVGSDGGYFGRIWTFRDITERTRSAALLLESQQRLALATESARIGIWDWNVVENKMVWDAQMLALYGIRPQDFSGAVDAWQKGLHPEDKERAEAEIAAALAGPHDFRSEFRVVWPGGEVHDIQAHGVVQRAADGSPTRMIGVNWDITARKRTEARFRRLVESNVQGILFWTATGGITHANDSFLNLTGHSREDLETGQIDWVDLTPPEYAHLDRRALEEIAAHGTSALYEKEFNRKDGSRVPVLLGSTAFEDNPAEGVCFVVDLTERKRLETQLVQSQKMETVGKLAGGIAHEFNSILTAIIGQSELLLADLPSGSPLVTNATEITKAAGRAAALTRQLLAYGRKQLLQPEALDLNRVITRMEGMLRHLMGGEIDTRMVATPGLHAVKADAGQLEQVIMQMALNARDAMPNGGKFTLETANVSFDQESIGNYPELKPGDYVMLAITDTGQGMSAEVKARLFEPFFSTKGIGQGTGLGLSTCYGIVKQSGGHISVYSELARGATFKIYLPQVAQVKAVSVRPPAPTDLPRGTETILLVEDDPALREMASALLRRLGYTVLAAANGIEALCLKQQRGTGHVDLLFTDVVMPHMSGKELADRVQALYPHTRVLYTSAYTANAIAHQDVLSKGVALLHKPFMPSALAHKVREVLDQQGNGVSRD